MVVIDGDRAENNIHCYGIVEDEISLDVLVGTPYHKMKCFPCAGWNGWHARLLFYAASTSPAATALGEPTCRVAPKTGNLNYLSEDAAGL
jgi:hypothetical protein